jgi:hypothetical protein
MLSAFLIPCIRATCPVNFVLRYLLTLTIFGEEFTLWGASLGLCSFIFAHYFCQNSMSGVCKEIRETLQWYVTREYLIAIRHFGAPGKDNKKWEKLTGMFWDWYFGNRRWWRRDLRMEDALHVEGRNILYICILLKCSETRKWREHFLSSL